MRAAILALVIALAALPAAADDTDPEGGRFSLGTSLEEAAEAAVPSGFSLDLEASFDRPSGGFDTSSLLTVRSDREYRAIFWDDPLGRVRYAMAAEEAMLGRGGLVHGGRMSGVGMSGAVLGDGSRSGIGLLLDGRAWGEMTGAERARAGFDLALTAGILWALVDGFRN